MYKAAIAPLTYSCPATKDKNYDYNAISFDLPAEVVDGLLGADPAIGVDGQHSLHDVLYVLVQPYARVAFVLEVGFEVLNHVQLLLYYLLEEPAFHCKCSVPDYLLIVYGHKGLQAHPEGNARYDFKDHTSQTPCIDDPGVIVVLQKLE